VESPLSERGKGVFDTCVLVVTFELPGIVCTIKRMHTSVTRFIRSDLITTRWARARWNGVAP